MAQETDSDPVSQPSQSPSLPGGLDACPSTEHSSEPPTANECVAAQGSVNSPGACNPPVWSLEPDTDAL